MNSLFVVKLKKLNTPTLNNKVNVVTISFLYEMKKKYVINKTNQY